MATTAFQILWAQGFGAPDRAGASTRSSPLGACRALRLDGEVVKLHFSRTSSKQRSGVSLGERDPPITRIHLPYLHRDLYLDRRDGLYKPRTTRRSCHASSSMFAGAASPTRRNGRTHHCFACLGEAGSVWRHPGQYDSRTLMSYLVICKPAGNSPSHALAELPIQLASNLPWPHEGSRRDGSALNR